MRRTLFIGFILSLACQLAFADHMYKNIPNGVYKIACDDKENFCMDVASGSTGDAYIQVYESNNSSAQRFYIEYDSSKDAYKIQSKTNSSKYLGHHLDGLTYLYQKTSDGSDDFYWRFEPQIDGTYRIRTIKDYFDQSLQQSTCWLCRATSQNGEKIYFNVESLTTKRNTWKLILTDAAPLANGDYRISCAASKKVGENTEALGHIGLSMSNTSGDNVKLDFQKNDNDHKWTFTRQGDGTYTITKKGAPNTHLNLDASTGLIHTWSGFSGNVPNATSKWWIVPIDGGKYNIICQYFRGKYNGTGNTSGYGNIDVNNGNYVSGEQIKGWSNNDGDAQKWKIIAVDDKKTIEDGIYRIVYKYNNNTQNYGFNIAGNSKDPGASMRLWHDAGAGQTWEVEHIGDGLYTIKYADSHLPLEAKNGDVINDTRIIQNTRVTNASNQEWFIRKNGSNGYYTIVNHRALRSLDLDGGVTADERVIHLWDASGTGQNQTWDFEPVYEDVNIGTAQYATLYYGNYNLKVPEGVEALTVDLNEAKNRIQTHRAYDAGKVIPKTEPVVVHYKAGNLTGNTTFKFQRMPDSPVTQQKSDKNQLRGTDTESDIGVDPKMTDDQFLYTLVRLTETTVGFNIMPAKNVNGVSYAKGKYLKNGAHRAYLLVDRSKLGGNMPASISFDLDDEEETDIQALPEATNYKLQTTDEIYNLSGQRLQKMQRGINIVGGKKVVIK